MSPDRHALWAKRAWIIALQRVLLLLLSLFLLGFSTAGLRSETEAANNKPQLFWIMPTLLTVCLDYTSAYVQTLKWAWQRNFGREKFSFECVANKQWFEYSNIFTALIYSIPFLLAIIIISYKYMHIILSFPRPNGS